MLFDLRGKRRRAVQVTYLGLAMLMGGGLVFFGIGGSVSGGLLDAFKGGGGGSSGNGVLKKQIDRERRRAATGNETVLKGLVRDYYQLAASQTNSGSSSFPESAKGDLRNAGIYWRRYLKAAKKPDPSLAAVALHIFDENGLNQPKDAEAAVQIAAEKSGDPSTYLALVKYAALAGDKRTADLAAIKAVDLAPKSQRKQVKLFAEQYKKGGGQLPPAGG